jgi:3-oxoacyl-[acyl-carrier protein] reductase
LPLAASSPIPRSRARFHSVAPMMLANRISAQVTGAAIVVDGGLSLTNWF